MRKNIRKPSKKNNKNAFEERFKIIVDDYHKAKELLDSLSAGTDEYEQQKKKCHQLFSHAERYLNSAT
ncbi:hypothetical protein [Photobacterium leiognathi]|uniref:hypothetical protein n=1 Tax=Photobacterium leiognathi TaxID=553611 RepID=UPI000769A7F1|nr:hypothetical protein [Photobacterium leiognathi]